MRAWVALGWCIATLGCSLDTSGAGDGSATAGSSSESGGTATSQGSVADTASSAATSVASESADGTTTRPDPTTTTQTTNSDDTATTSDGTTGDECARPSTACLVARGLLARYFLDEAESGDGPNHALDSAPNPLDLPIDKDDNMSYSTYGGNTGLEWQTAGGNGSAFISVAGTKLATIDGQVSATIEAVIEVRSVINGSRVVNFGQGSEGGLFTLRLQSENNPRLWWNHETVMGSWDRDLQDIRAVVHVVYDSNQGDPDDRRRLYVDGQLVAPTGGDPPGMGAGIDLFLGDPEFSLGNRANGNRAMEGVLYYAALYTEALSQDEIYYNVAILELDDDRPDS